MVERRNYEEYKAKILDALYDVFPDYIISLEKHSKINVTKERITIREKNYSGGLTKIFYLDDLYDITGGDVSKSISEISNKFESYKGTLKAVDEKLNSFTKDDLLKNLYFKVINTEKNKDLLANIPNRPCLEGLSIVYYVALSEDSEKLGSMMVRNNMLKFYPFLEGMTEEDLYEQAVKNAPTMEPKIYNVIERLGADICSGLSQDDKEICCNNYYGKTIDDVVIENDDIKKFFKNLLDEPPMFVLTSKAEFNAFGLVLVPEIFKKVVSFFKGNSFYIIPSSVHEVILLPEDEFSDSEEIKNIISNANVTALDESEYLSDNLFLYDSDVQQIITVEN